MALHGCPLSSWAYPGPSCPFLAPRGSFCPPPGSKSQQNSPELAMAPLAPHGSAWLPPLLLGSSWPILALPGFSWLPLPAPWLQVPAELARTRHGSPGSSWLCLASPSPLGLILAHLGPSWLLLAPPARPLAPSPSRTRQNSPWLLLLLLLLLLMLLAPAAATADVPNRRARKQKNIINFLARSPFRWTGCKFAASSDWRGCNLQPLQLERLQSATSPIEPVADLQLVQLNWLRIRNQFNWTSCKSATGSIGLVADCSLSNWRGCKLQPLQSEEAANLQPVHLKGLRARKLIMFFCFLARLFGTSAVAAAGASSISSSSRSRSRSHGEFWRVLLGLGARGRAGGARRSQEGPRWARMSPRGEGEARQSHEEPGEPWRVLASSAGTWSQGAGRGSQEKPGRAKMGQDEPKRRGGSQAEP